MTEPAPGDEMVHLACSNNIRTVPARSGDNSSSTTHSVAQRRDSGRGRSNPQVGAFAVQTRAIGDRPLRRGTRNAPDETTDTDTTTLSSTPQSPVLEDATEQEALGESQPPSHLPLSDMEPAETLQADGGSDEVLAANCEVNVNSNVNKGNNNGEDNTLRAISLLLFGGLLFITIVVLVTLALTVADDPIVILSPSSPPTKDNENQIDFPWTPSSTQIALWAKFGPLSSNADIFSDWMSPQSLAVTWLSLADTFIEQEEEIEARYALSTLYFASSGGYWTDDLNFLRPTSVCHWNANGLGVFCDSEGHVRDLIIDQQNGLSGSLPEELKLLTMLETLRISHQVDLETPSLQALSSVDAWGYLPALRVLDLSFNNLAGQIPAAFSNIITLQELYLNDNQFGGNLPESYENLTAMKVLHLQNNLLNGFADTGIYNMKDLEELCLQGNKVPEVTGLEIETEFWLLMTNLRILNLSGITKYGGEYVLRLLTRLSNLEVFVWDDGNLIMEVPDFPDANLTFISLHNNMLTGSIPWASLPATLTHLDLGLNAFTGSIPGENITHLSNLEYLDLSFNSLEGTIPDILLSTLDENSVILEGNNFTLDIST